MATQPGLGVEFLPGAGAFIDPPGAVANPAATLASLNSNTQRAATLESALADALVSRITAGLTRATDIRNQLEGAAESRLAAQGQKAQGIASKLQKAANRALGQSYTYAFPYGYQYPTNEEAYARLQQGPGVYFADVAPTAQPVPPVPVGNVPTTPGGIPVGLEPSGIPRVVPVPLPTQPQPGVSPGNGPGFVPVVPTGCADPFTSCPPQSRMPDGRCEVVPRGADGCCPPGYTAAGDFMQECQFIPTGGAPSPPPGANGQPATCPAGFVPVSSSSYLAGTTPFLPPPPTPFGIQPFQPRTMQGGSSCPQPVSGSFPPTYDPATSVNNPGVGEMVLPWTQPVYFGQPGDMQQACIDGACIGQPGTSLALYFPTGFFLVYDPATGQLMAATGIPPGWEEMGLAPCSDKPAVPPGNVPPGCVPAPPAAQCPVPAPADCGPDKNLQLPPINLGVDVICAHIDQVLQSLVNNPTTFEDLMGMKAGQAPSGDAWKNWAYALLGVTNPVLPDLFGRLGKWLQGIQQKVANMVAGGDVQLLQVSVTRGLILLIHKYTGSVPAQLLHDIDYVSNTVRQSRLPTTAAADSGWLANMVTDDEWECYVKANGDYVDQARHIRDARRTRPNARTAQKLFIRNFIDQERFDQLVRADGVISDADKQDVLNEDNYWPSVSEIFRWQQEQLYNEDVIARFELDQDWDQEYADHLKDRTDGHQMKESDARRHYMSMWKRPGYSELVEMTRRLRPGRVDDSLVFTDDDLNTALKQEGHPDFFLKRLAAIRTHKPTRQDVRQLYDFHVIDETELKDELKDMGYASDYADQQVARWQIERQLQDYHRSGYPAAGTLANLYARGELSQNEFQNLAQRVVFYDGQLDDMTQAAVTAENVENKRLAIQGVKSQFTSGLVDISTAQGELAAAGIDGDQIARLTAYWHHVKKSTPKQVGASTLCQWRKDHLIGPIEQAAALTRLGYTGTDVELIVADCTYKIALAAEKAQASAQKQATAAASKAAAAQAKAAKAAAKGAKTTSPP